LNLDWSLPITIWTFHDPGRDGFEINLLQIEDMAAAWADVYALPMCRVVRVVRGRIHTLSSGLLYSNALYFSFGVLLRIKRLRASQPSVIMRFCASPNSSSHSSEDRFA